MSAPSHSPRQSQLLTGRHSAQRIGELLRSYYLSLRERVSAAGVFASNRMPRRCGIRVQLTKPARKAALHSTLLRALRHEARQDQRAMAAPAPRTVNTLPLPVMASTAETSPSAKSPWPAMIARRPSPNNACAKRKTSSSG